MHIFPTFKVHIHLVASNFVQELSKFMLEHKMKVRLG